MSTLLPEINLSQVAKRCDCTCHRPGSNIMHFMPCCGGQCKGCHQHWHNLELHQQQCYMYGLWFRKNEKNRK